MNTSDASNVLVVADGAAFGSEIDKVMYLLKDRSGSALYLPESFEWLVLSSGIVNDSEVGQILEDPEKHIESRLYFSWERFFTELLVKKTEGTYLAYKKRSLNETYLSGRVKAAILSCMEGIEFRTNRGAGHKQTSRRFEHEQTGTAGLVQETVRNKSGLSMG